MSFLTRWLSDEPRIEDPSAGIARVREALARASVDAQAARLEKAHYRPRTNYALPHELGHPVMGVTGFHAAKKLHEHYEKVNEARKAKGKEIF